MKKSLLTLLAILVAISMLAAQCAGAQPTPEPPAAEEPAAEQPAEEEAAEEEAVAEEEPAPAEPSGVTITWATIAGFYTDWAEEVAKDFEEATGHNVEVVDIDFPQLYEKQVLEMVGGTGAYDIITYDVGWKAEFANNGYLAPLDDYIAASDPAEIEFEDVAPALVELTTGWKGEVFGLPYYTFTMGMFYRCDLFEHPEEQAAFEAKYGYPLDVPQTYEQMADIAEFFTREAGETLAGEVLEDDFYGIGLMAGRFPHIQDEIMSIAWTEGGGLINDDGSVNVESVTEATQFYVNEMLPNAPPGALTSAYDEVMGQMRQGIIAQTAAFYLDQWPNAVKTEAEVPGAEVCAAASPGAHTWVGAFGLGLSVDSEHPDEAWEFLKFLSGPEAQRKFAQGGGTTTRMSILEDPEILALREQAGHFPVLVDVLDHAKEAEFYPNYYYVPQGGKIYDEETTWFSSAAAGEYSPEEAMQNLAEAIERICGGPCEVVNDHLGADYSPQPMPYTFDKSLQIRAGAPAAAAPAAPEKPALEMAAEPQTITWATIAGFYTDWAEEVAKEFEEATGHNVEVVDIDFPQLYEKQVLEMVGGTGAYDIITYDVGWKAEFANNGYLAPLDDYIAASDPAEIEFEDVAPALVELTTGWKGEVFGLPYYTFTMGMFYRCDLFEHPEEQAAFEAEYGYPLDVPQTYEQMADIAEFFTREAGETLAGEVLEDDFYGIGLMAGRFPHIQDEIMSIAWTEGGGLINDDGSVNVESVTEATQFYVNEMLPYAPPGALTSAYDEVMGQMRQGIIAQTAAFYLDQWPNAVKTEAEVPGAEVCAAASPGAHTWVGAFGLGLSVDSEHPDAAWEFLKFLSGPYAQRKFAQGGGTTTRMSILEDPEILALREQAGHFPALVDVLEHAADCEFYPNYYYVPQGGKIYDEETTWFSSAAAGEYSPEEAMQNLAESIERICGGPCEVVNDHLGADYSPQPCPYTFDKSLQIRQ